MKLVACAVGGLSGCRASAPAIGCITLQTFHSPIRGRRGSLRRTRSSVRRRETQRRIHFRPERSLSRRHFITFHSFRKLSMVVFQCFSGAFHRSRLKLKAFHLFVCYRAWLRSSWQQAQAISRSLLAALSPCIGYNECAGAAPWPVEAC